MAGIGGIGSGIETSSIIQATVNAERAPKESQLKRLETATTTKFSSLGTLRSAASTFQGVLNKLNEASLYKSRTATLSASGYFSATASVTAPAGKYEIQVQQLASGSKVGLKSFVEPVAAEGSTPVGPNKFSSGTLTLSAGDPNDPASKKINIAIGESNNTLAGIRDAINTQGAEQGFSASLLTDASGTRLVISSSTMGDGKDVQVQVAAGETPEPGQIDLAELAFAPALKDPADPTAGFAAPNSTLGDGAAGVVTQAHSSRVTVDGLQVVRESNSIEGVIEGVTLNLTKADTAQTISLTVGVDKSKVATSLKEFVSAYNAMQTSIGGLGAVVSLGEGVKPTVGALVGDSSLRNLQAGLRTEMSRVQQGGGLAGLAQLGITTNKDGTLSLDSAKLDKALGENFEEVSGYLTGEAGLFTRLNKTLNAYTKSDGILDQRQAGLRKTLNGIDSERKALDTRMEKLESRLVAQYTAMDLLVTKLMGTSDWLGAQLKNLPGVVRKD